MWDGLPARLQVAERPKANLPLLAIDTASETGKDACPTAGQNTLLVKHAG